jgi:hypothetical protein
MAKMSSTVHGLAQSAPSVHVSPEVSEHVGVGCGCQARAVAIGLVIAGSWRHDRCRLLWAAAEGRGGLGPIGRMPSDCCPPPVHRVDLVVSCSSVHTLMALSAATRQNRPLGRMIRSRRARLMSHPCSCAA